MTYNEKAQRQQWNARTVLSRWSRAQENHMEFGEAVIALKARPSALQSTIHESYGQAEEQVLINRQDVMNKVDAWDVQEFITRMFIKQLLQHPAFQLLLAVLLVINAITIALRTSSYLDQKHYELFSTIDNVVLTILICEVLLGWLNGFWIFWKDGWNILNFIIVFQLLLGFFSKEINIPSINYTLRALRLVHVCMAVEPLARIIRVILTSVPDLANITILILFFMLIFSVFGVTLFGAFVPKHFQNMRVALYTLFICITQDGWVDIYSDFQTEKREYAMEIGGAIYFTIFITIGAFIGINLFVVVVTTNLEQMMKAEEQGQQHRIIFSETGAEEEEDENQQLPVVHCVVARSEKSGLPQEPLVGGPLSNLNENTCDNFCLVLEAIQENLTQYKEIRDELNTIVEEVRAIRFNQEQEAEVLQRRKTNGSLETMSSKDLRHKSHQQDLLSALIDMEKVHDSSSHILLKTRKSSH
ncbi:cation channel sperm-associated protein 4 [Saimiri boliviensis]|uniref:Cation channel sperm associated 4 n=1 Tax=Saimiri boliviensis boliviensis TaxID=39432 RepID=A0A2K6UKI5_SAIBB|nr:cation channel sperm-associated protein 4 [Saimiri boliviensis boliviensis]